MLREDWFAAADFIGHEAVDEMLGGGPCALEPGPVRVRRTTRFDRLVSMGANAKQDHSGHGRLRNARARKSISNLTLGETCLRVG